ncbi:8888_t:CDS:1, partial [Funneliformis geosporum]
SILREVSRPQQRRKDCEHKNQIQTVYNNRENRSLMEFLQGIAHNLSF